MMINEKTPFRIPRKTVHINIQKSIRILRLSDIVRNVTHVCSLYFLVARKVQPGVLLVFCFCKIV